MKSVVPRRLDKGMGSKDYSAAASRLAKLARRQHGLVTREQALQAEMSERAIDLRIASGEWHRILHGVYRLPGAGSSWLQDLTAVCLSLKGAVVSHRAAAALLKLGGFEPGMVELTTCRPQRPPEWLASEPPGRKAPTLLVHHSKLMPAKDVVKIERIPATSVARTLLELGAVVPEAEVERALDDALRRGLTSLVSLRRRLEELGRKGRGGTAVLRSLIESRVPGEIPRASSRKS